MFGDEERGQMEHDAGSGGAHEGDETVRGAVVDVTHQAIEDIA